MIKDEIFLLFKCDIWNKLYTYTPYTCIFLFSIYKVEKNIKISPIY